jgi:hypothetical protein
MADSREQRAGVFVRLPLSVRDRIQQDAVQNRRSMTKELQFQIERLYAPPQQIEAAQ